jgi:hypothetical protein
LAGKTPYPDIAASFYIPGTLGRVDRKSYEAWTSNACVSQVVKMNGKPCRDNETA